MQETDGTGLIEKREPTKFLRLLTDEYGELVALQTPTVRYVRTDEQGNVKLEVFLESVVHIADASYFRGFDKRFEHYDCVLFELVMGPDESVDDEGQEAGVLSMLQNLSGGSLGLSYQFDEVNYQRGNFVHSDLTTDEIAERMRERGQNQVTLFTDLLVHMSQKGKQAPLSDMSNDTSSGLMEPTVVQPQLDMGILSHPDGIMKIRRLLANAVGNSEILETSMPPALHSMLVTDRNERAMEVFQKQLDQGKRRIAFFWGAGHMADFEKRLLVDYGLKPAETNWRNAWDLRDGAVPGAPLEGLLEATFKDTFKEKLRGLVRRSGQKRKAEKAKQEAAQDKKRISEMEATLKALEAKIESMKEQASSGGDGTGTEQEEEDESESDEEDESDSTSNAEVR